MESGLTSAKLDVSESFRVVRKAERASTVDMPPVKVSIAADGKLAANALVIELTAVCNAQCPGCFPQYLDLPQGFFDIGAAREAIVSYARKGGRTLCLTARGEPLLDKRIPEVVRFAKDIGLDYVEFTSNAQLLNLSMCRRLLDSGLDTLRISMTGSTQEVYARWQGFKSPFKLAQVEANVLRFIGLRNALGRETPRVVTRYIYDGTKDNTDAIAYLRRWVLLADDVQFTMRLPVIHHGQAAKVKNPEDIPSLFSSGEGKIRCPAVQRNGGAVAVTSEGTVSLCNSGLGDPDLTVGNLIEEPFDTVVEKYFAGMERLDDQMTAGIVSDLPKACQSCFGIVDGGNNCQDFDLLLLMAVARTADRAKALADEEDRSIVLFGATTAAKMLLLNHDFSSRVKYVLDDAKPNEDNPFAPRRTFKDLSLRNKLDPIDAAHAIIVFANDEPCIQAEAIAAQIEDPARFIAFKDEFAAVNAETFRLPFADAVYDVPWNVWHTQMQLNFYTWYVTTYLCALDGLILLSLREFYETDKFLQLDDLASKVAALVRLPGLPAGSPAQDVQSLRYKDVLSLNEAAQWNGPATFFVWTATEARTAREAILRKNRSDITVLEYSELLRQAKDTLAFGQ